MTKRSILLFSAVTLLACAGAEKKDSEPVVALEGYQTVGSVSCYFAPSVQGLSSSETNTLNRQILSESKAHWRGEIEPSLKFSERAVGSLEDQVLNNPEDLKPITDKSTELCKAWAGKDSGESYEKALLSFASSLDSGRCEPQLLEMYSMHLAVNLDWQGELTLCADQKVNIKLSDGRYTLRVGSAEVPAEYIDAAGALSESVEDGAFPCKEDGCFPGMVIGRYQPWEGEEWIFPIGRNMDFRAPSSGVLSVRVNDADYSDNAFFQENQVLDYLTLEVSSQY